MITPIGKHYLYRHIRLDTGEPFYIGIGTNAEKCGTQKCNYQRAYSNQDRSNFWNKIVNKTEYEVEILLESDDYEFIKQKEIEFIALYGRRNKKEGILCNLTDGGDGGLGRVLSSEIRSKISSKVKGRKQDEKAMENIRKAHRLKNENYAKEKEGKSYKTKYGSLTLIKYFNADNCTVEFDDGTIVEKCGFSAVTKGLVRNFNHKSVYGIGYIGYGKYKRTENGKTTNAYSYWVKMIKNVKEGNWGITEDWKCFQNFAQWYENNKIKNFVLDKQLFSDSKTYSSETVCFLPKTIVQNLLKCTCNSEKLLPIGVSRDKNAFRVLLDGRSKNVNTVEEAIELYNDNKKTKLKNLLVQHKEQLSNNVYKKLINIIETKY